MIKRIARKLINKYGYDIIPAYPDMDSGFNAIYEMCKEYTVTSRERMYALYMATKYVAENFIKGDIVECGVWKGGSMMLCALTLNEIGKNYRTIYLYDTFNGMTEPTEKDVDYKGGKAVEEWGDYNKWCSIPREEVESNMSTTYYPPENIMYVEGKVEDTIPETMPENISILRLDTDWYESTYHELVHLFPLLVPDGVLIVDDYGHFRGVREAVDQYIEEKNVRILLNRIDYTGRIGIKT